MTTAEEELLELVNVILAPHSFLTSAPEAPSSLSPQALASPWGLLL